jgi:hypothetical protein
MYGFHNAWQGTISLIARAGDLHEDRLEFGEIVACQSAGINRHEVENERVSQERSSEPS